MIDGSVVSSTAACGRSASQLRARFAAHDQREKIGIGRVGRAVRMIRREEDAHRIVDQKEEFEPGRPLHGIVEIVRAVIEGHDAARHSHRRRR